MDWPAFPPLSTVAGSALVLLAAAYALAALLCRVRTARTVGLAAGWPTCVPVTVLKPLCGAEPRLEANLACLCMQHHPRYQIVFGVRAPDDPAIAVVERLRQRFPAANIDLVVDPRVHGSNLKVSNLINMMPAARHPWLVLADSDVAVGPDYLARVTAPLAGPDTGIVTCLYRGRPLDAFWSRVGALFIDTWFAPSVRVASSAGSSAFGFGATIALRASTLRAIGGIGVLKDRLADDFRLGELTRALGLETVLSDVCVDTDVAETTLGALWARERRWMQTIRSVNPLGHAFACITFTLPMLALGLVLAPTPVNAALALAGAAARFGLHWRRPASGAPPPGRALYAPLRDCLLLAEWLSAFVGTTARWRAHRVPIDTGRVPAPSPVRAPAPDAGPRRRPPARHRSWTR